MVAPAFRWHPGARLTGPDGAVGGPGGPPRVTGPDRPAVDALRGAMAAAGAGLPFRVGGQGPEPCTGDAPAFETLTGGTSGTPCRIRRHHASWTASFALDAARFGIGPGVAIGVPGRLVHSLPLYGAIGALHLGADLHLLDGLRPDRQALALAARRIAVLWVTPAQLGLMLTNNPPLPDLRWVLVGGGALDDATRARLAGAAPKARIVAFYGTAEASFIAMADDRTPAGSVGRPYPGVEVDVTHPTGEIRVRGPYLAEGHAGPRAGPTPWRDGWVHTGDIGRMEDGYLFVTGRADRMVRIADQTVWPDAVEAFLMTLPGVTAAAVLPRPDPARGTVLEAVLTGAPQAEPAILAALRAAFGPMAAPRRIVWRAALPLTPAGKVDLAALRAS